MTDSEEMKNHPNNRNDNNFNEGKTNLNIRDTAMTYQYGGYSPDTMARQMSLSVACQSGTDVLHSVGNVTAILLQFILDQFPSNTFATAMPSTKLAHRQLRHTPKQIRTQPYPMCIVNPRISLLANDDRLGAGSFATTTWSSASDRYQNRSEMVTLLQDPRIGIEWRGKINRVVLYLDFVLAFKSVAEQTRWASYLINRLPIGNGYLPDIETALELALPDGFLQATSDYIKIPIKDKMGSVVPFIDYMNMHSVYPISYRFSSGRHKDAFYANYSAPLLCSINDFNYTNTTRTGQVESDCPITFTLRCEYTTIGLFELCHPNPGMIRLLPHEEGGVVIPIFSDNFNEKDFPLEYGWVIHARPICQMDWGEHEVSFAAVLGDGINKILDFHLKHHLKPELFISIKLRENHILIEDGYYIDWENKKIVFTTISYTHTYRIIIAVNKLYIQDSLISMYGK